MTQGTEYIYDEESGLLTKVYNDIITIESHRSSWLEAYSQGLIPERCEGISP
ncbi:MAG: hypothetical protein KIT33_10280 [Candidatus Kapabacteria bacterium]|nr:hypothetical protein [Ignavibacteriota bacterium]MCW5885345.1 hypothetical protein [Candidatus Kapabacteria bacterium]